MSSIAFRTIEGRVTFVKEINFKQSLKLFLVLLRMIKKINQHLEIQKFQLSFCNIPDHKSDLKSKIKNHRSDFVNHLSL